MRLTGLFLFAMVATTAAGSAADLVENGRFDSDIDGWTAVAGSEIEWSPVDELGSPLSGSLKVKVLDHDLTANRAAQCVPVAAGTTYAFGTDARILAGQDLVSPSVSVHVNWSTGVACNPTQLGLTGDAVIELQGVWGNAQGWATAPPGALSAVLLLRVLAEVDPGSIEVEFDNVFFAEDSTCGVSPTTLCLNEGRFRVGAEWETKFGETGYGRARSLTDDSGYFWFFNEDNVELVTKLLNACPTQSNRFWFFAAGLTNVETVIRVHDTGSDAERVYMNPQETPFKPIQDIKAFDTCP
jgi:hypothetical protein